MILCLDVGNTQIHAGVFENNELILQFRKSSQGTGSSDETGIFLKSVLRENGIDPAKIKEIAMCSVVPGAVYSIRNGCIKYFDVDPFILQAGVKTGLKIKYRNPLEVGADRIANAIAGTQLYPDKNLIIVDFGTATTFDVITKAKDYLGGVIIPGIKISGEALENKTSKLLSVEIVVPEETVGRSTKESIQSGLYYSQLAVVKELKERIKNESFGGKTPIVIGTGGFANLFVEDPAGGKDAKLFDAVHPDLVLKGLIFSLNMNR